MNFLCALFVLFCGIAVEVNGAVKIIDGSDPRQCNSSDHADQVLVRDRGDKEILLICTEDNGVYQWRKTDGLNPPGELFNPGYDCSDILDKDVEAKDGFYWIHLDGPKYSPKKVYCDMATDGGGFMLIGRQTNSITWTVPSNVYPVEPFGFPHWSSELGDAPILDFRVQMATAEDFEETKAHWSFRLQAKRQLKNLMVMNQGGCDGQSAGIGNISYVKDLQTESIVTTNLRCSKFGWGHHPLTSFGWSMMNSCLQKPCPQGFAFHHEHPVQTDFYGAFSYSVTGNISGTNYDATALVGCDKGTCCGCYGPVGGTKNYCTEKCKPLNGGTVTKDVFTWFWVRSVLPKKVWNKCMEYNVVKDNGKIVWFKLLGESAVPTEGRCSKNNVFLHNGVVVVSDASTVKKIPHVAGLLAYRKDNKELYIRANKTWSVVAQENKVDTKFAEIDKRLGKQNKTLAKQTINLQKQLENQNRNLTDKLNAFTSIIDQLNKQLQEVRNETFKNNQYGERDSSVILKRRQNYLSKLREWLPSTSPWKLCYRATRDGWASTTFHSKCDNKGPTVTIVRVGSYVFGGYTDVSWDSSNSYKTTWNSFIFSLKNKDNLAPFKAPVFRYSQLAIHCRSSYGPRFGEGADFSIANNANSNTESYTNFGSTYQPPSGYSYGSSNIQALLAGSFRFTPSEVEVFYLR